VNRLAAEVAEASRLLGDDHPLTTELRKPAIFVKPTTGNALVDCAKRVQRLSSKASRLRRELKTVEQNLKVEKRHLKALVQEVAGKGQL